MPKGKMTIFISFLKATSCFMFLSFFFISGEVSSVFQSQFGTALSTSY